MPGLMTFCKIAERVISHGRAWQNKVWLRSAWLLRSLLDGYYFSHGIYNIFKGFPRDHLVGKCMSSGQLQRHLWDGDEDKAAVKYA